jgi:hypothetical protein
VRAVLRTDEEIADDIPKPPGLVVVARRGENRLLHGDEAKLVLHGASAFPAVGRDDHDWTGGGIAGRGDQRSGGSCLDELALDL